MKKHLYVFLLLAGGLFMTSCSSQDSENSVEDQEVAEEVISEETKEILNEVQDINEEAAELEEELDAFMDSL